MTIHRIGARGIAVTLVFDVTDAGTATDQDIIARVLSGVALPVALNQQLRSVKVSAVLPLAALMAPPESGPQT